jgi:predicted HicB family RNase H-like nuclease
VSSRNRSVGRPKVHTEARVTTAVRLPKSLYKRARHEALDRDSSVNHLVCKALEYYLDRLPPVEP